MSPSLSEIRKSVPGVVLEGIRSEARHVKNTRRLRRLNPADLAAENAKRAAVGLPAHYVSPTLHQRLTTIKR